MVDGEYQGIEFQTFITILYFMHEITVAYQMRSKTNHIDSMKHRFFKMIR